MALPLRSGLAMTALALVWALAAAPTLSEPPRREPAAKPQDPQAVGLPVFTADGKAIGKVVATGTDEENAPVLIAEIERQLGLGPEAVAIPTDLYVHKQGRIELTLTEAEVNARLAR